MQSKSEGAEEPVAATEPAPAAAAGPKPRPKRTFRKSVRHFRIDHLLKPEDLREYQQFLRRPSTTIESAVAWLAQRNYVITRSAVHRHRKAYTEELEELRNSARLAAELAELGRGEGPAGGTGGGGGVFAEAAQTLFEQRLMQRLHAAVTGGGGDDDDEAGALAGAKQWDALAKAVAGAVAARRQVEAMRAEFERRSAEAVKVVRDAEKDLPQYQYTGRPGFADTSQTAKIAERVRRVLGM